MNSIFTVFINPNLIFFFLNVELYKSIYTTIQMFGVGKMFLTYFWKKYFMLTKPAFI